MTLKTLDYDLACRTTEAVRYVVMKAAANVVPLAPRFVFGGLPPELCHFMFGGGTTHTIGYYAVRNARLARDNIVLLGQTALTGVTTNHPEHHCREMLGESAPTISSGRIAGMAVSLSGPGWSTWGHWLVDFLPRLYMFHSIGWDLNAVRWIIPADVPDYVHQLLMALGIASDSVVLHDHHAGLLEVDELIVPQNLERIPFIPVHSRRR